MLRKLLGIVAVLLPLSGFISPGGTGTLYAQSALKTRHSVGAKLSASAKAELTRQLSEAVQRGDTPGVVAALVNRDGLLYCGTAGKLDVAQDKPMIPDAIFAIASMTKPVTSVAIMMLLERGKLRLDDPVSKYLPGFDNLRVITKFNEENASYETRPAARPITIRHLLTHTSGIAYPFSNPIESRLAKATKKNFWELPLLNDPGDKWTYGPSTRLLGRVVEKITGVPLEMFFQENIFRPLGMVDTSYAVPSAKQARVPTRHQRTNGTLKEQERAAIPAVPTPPFAGDGGLYSTAEDYGRFVQMILNGGRARPERTSARILTESSVKMMGENNIGSIFVELQPIVDESVSKSFPLGAGHDKFGLGFQIAARDSQNARFRSPGSMSWAGIFNTEFWVDPVKHIGGIQLMQLLPFYDEGAIRTLRGFEETVYRNLQ